MIFDEYPKSILRLICSLYLHLFSLPSKGLSPSSLSLKINAKVRVMNIAHIAWTPPGGRLPAANDVKRLVVIRGTLSRAGLAKTLEYQRMMECGKCHCRWTVQADPKEYYTFPKSFKCPSQSATPCNPKGIQVVEGSIECKDYQEIKLQEQVRRLAPPFQF